MRTKRLNDKGFSLIELLLSIAILAIIIVPLFNNFVTSGKVQRNTKILSSVESTSVSLLESTKSKEIDEIKNQFIAGDISIFKLLPLNSEAKLRRLKPELTGGWAECNAIEKTQKASKYYFAIDELKIGGLTYDLIMSIDTSKYGSSSSSSSYSKYNEYKLPVMMQLNQEKVAMVNTMLKLGPSDDDTIDKFAVKEFIRRRKEYKAQKDLEYALQLNTYNAAHSAWQALIDAGTDPAEIEEPTAPAPFSGTELSEGEITPKLTKKTTISFIPFVDSGVSKVKVVANATYTVDNSLIIADPTNGSMQCFTYNLLDVIYNNNVSYLYLYYTPSTVCSSGGGKTEEIEIINQQKEGGKYATVNAYIMMQGEPISTRTTPYCSIKNVEGIQPPGDPQPLEIFTDMKKSEKKKSENQYELNNFDSTYNPSTIERKPEASVSIYDIDIKVYEHPKIAADMYKKEIYHITSTGMNE